MRLVIYSTLAASAALACAVCAPRPTYAQPADASLGVPSGLIGFFDRRECPRGWTRETRLDGRYVVGANQPAKVGASVGKPLDDGENRPTGQHDHRTTATVVGEDGSAAGGYGVQSGGDSAARKLGGALVRPAGAVAGTNAPYVVFLACRKS